MVEKICNICNCTFEVPHWRESSAKYCSTNCQHTSLKSRTNCECFVCGKPIYRKPSHIKKSISKKFACSYECTGKSKADSMKGELNHQYGLKGDLNSSFKGGEINRKNNNLIDVRVLSIYHPFKDKDSRVLKHRLLVEENFHFFDSKYFLVLDDKHYLKTGVDVHHKDGDHNNNDISNLEPLTRSEHTSLHNKQKEWERDHLGKFKKQVSN